MNGITVGFALCGSFCTISEAIEQMKLLRVSGADIVPIMSHAVYTTDTRFGTAEQRRKEVEGICNREIIHTIAAAEPIGPKKLLDILIISPCTGNTAGKLANGITDTAVTLAAKAHLRNERPLLLGIATNDALGASAVNIGRLMNCKNVFFVPMRQDDSENKPKSIVADFTKLQSAAKAALGGRQLQPVLGHI